LNWVIRWAWPKPVRQARIQLSWVCSGTSGLQENCGSVGIHPGGQHLRRAPQRPVAQHRRLDLHGQRVQVGHAVERLMIILQRHPLPERAEVVAEVQESAVGWASESTRGAVAGASGEDMRVIVPRSPTPFSGIFPSAEMVLDR
jgi:hypothetical protein